MKRTIIITLLFAACLLLFTACGGNAAPAGAPDGSQTDATDAADNMPRAEQFTLTLSHPNNTNHPYHVGAETFKELVAAYTDGNVTVEIYPSNQLSGPAATVQGVQVGTINCGIAASSHVVS